MQTCASFVSFFNGNQSGAFTLANMRLTDFVGNIAETMQTLRTLLFAVVVTLTGCSEYHEYSPNQVSDHNSPQDLNKKNLLKLNETPKDDTVTLAFLGDSQNFYDEVDPFVDKVNQIPAIDLVIIAGDISDYGLLQEFEWIYERLTGLNKPFIGVIGNHDLVASGELVYRKMFGALDFSFVYDSIKFIVHNTNSREYLNGNVPDMEWLGKELKPITGVQHYVGVSHVPPFSGDFDPAKETAYSDLLAKTPGFLVSLHGHIHRHTDAYPYDDGVRYITGPSFAQRNFVLLKISSGTISKTLIDY